MMAKGKPETLRGLILYNAQAICEVYKQKTFTSNDLFKEVVKDRPDTKKHALQTSVSKDMLSCGYFEKVKKSTPSILRLTEEGLKADPFTIVGLDTINRRKKKEAELKKLEKQPTDGIALTPVDVPAEVTDEERFSFVDSVVDRIVDLKNKVMLWEIKYTDLENKVKGDISKLHGELRTKTRELAEQNKKVVALSNRLRQTGGESALREEIEKWQQNQKKQTG